MENTPVEIPFFDTIRFRYREQPQLLGRIHKVDQLLDDLAVTPKRRRGRRIVIAVVAVSFVAILAVAWYVNVTRGDPFIVGVFALAFEAISAAFVMSQLRSDRYRLPASYSTKVLEDPRVDQVRKLKVRIAAWQAQYRTYEAAVYDYNGGRMPEGSERDAIPAKVAVYVQEYHDILAAIAEINASLKRVALGNLELAVETLHRLHAAEHVIAAAREPEREAAAAVRVSEGAVSALKERS